MNLVKLLVSNQFLVIVKSSKWKLIKKVNHLNNIRNRSKDRQVRIEVTVKIEAVAKIEVQKNKDNHNVMIKSHNKKEIGGFQQILMNTVMTV